MATEHRFSISCAQRNATTETETTILIVCTIIKLFIELSQNRNDGFWNNIQVQSIHIYNNIIQTRFIKLYNTLIHKI